MSQSQTDPQCRSVSDETIFDAVPISTHEPPEPLPVDPQQGSPVESGPDDHGLDWRFTPPTLLTQILSLTIPLLSSGLAIASIVYPEWVVITYSTPDEDMSANGTALPTPSFRFTLGLWQICNASVPSFNSTIAVPKYASLDLDFPQISFQSGLSCIPGNSRTLATTITFLYGCGIVLITNRTIFLLAVILLFITLNNRIGNRTKPVLSSKLAISVVIALLVVSIVVSLVTFVAIIADINTHGALESFSRTVGLSGQVAIIGLSIEALVAFLGYSLLMKRVKRYKLERAAHEAQEMMSRAVTQIFGNPAALASSVNQSLLDGQISATTNNASPSTMNFPSMTYPTMTEPIIQIGYPEAVPMIAIRPANRSDASDSIAHSYHSQPPSMGRVSHASQASHFTHFTHFNRSTCSLQIVDYSRVSDLRWQMRQLFVVFRRKSPLRRFHPYPRDDPVAFSDTVLARRYRARYSSGTVSLGS
ncbi:uncharacterized protein BJ171DRAFT_486630 [Polychytrium aggregatum]|uniref:uncharacterized protein n=1 Tax=Polychytrium aggregatum TaxID=110093 RepID=UPI0022FE26FC|nr:uncharacterized protein BJ171DRAFT_486630 [Polychytrium aggregatum]KAI9209370.1 hypothetical protein BJ171DRAFT_486630 [Polychytrium aggregatum]